MAAPNTQAVLDAGGVIIEILESNGVGFLPVQQSDLEAWININPPLEVTALMDPPGTTGSGQANTTLNTYGQRENTYVVDLQTMVILHKCIGSTTSAPPDSVLEAETCLMGLLSGDAGSACSMCQ